MLGITSFPRVPQRFDFGTAATESGYVAVGAETLYRPEQGYGWVGSAAAPDMVVRDRGGPDRLRRDFVFGRTSRVFRIDAPMGRYRLTVIAGDMDYGDHVLEIVVSGGGAVVALPVLRPVAAEFVTLEAIVTVAEGIPLDLTFRSPDNNWAVNALTLTPVPDSENTPPRVMRQSFTRAMPASSWEPVTQWPDPTAALLNRYRAALARKPTVRPTGLTRADYLKLIARGVDFWKKHQNDDGAIIDPYRKAEFQYSTPAFAHAAATLVVYAGRRDLIGPAVKALNQASRALSERRAASAHEDFYPPMLAHAIRLLKPRVPATVSARWEADIRRFDPFTTYRFRPGANNWNVVAMSGEFLFQKAGLRPASNTFVAASVAAQGKHFGSPYGLYLEGPIAYDHFPRLWAADMVASGYAGSHASELRESLRRAAVTSLFLQSPWGELPAGGRSAHHQWNEAEQCVTYEIYAARALKVGDVSLAAAFKRAAHLALASMRRWVRPSGELQIIKNWVAPEKEHAFETYSAHSQYGLLPLSMLAIAYEHAAPTEKIAEKPTPADVGGFVLHLEELHKVVANAGGMYIEVDTIGDHHYDATGLIRVHHPAVNPQLGPSDSVLADSAYRRPKDAPRPPQTTGIGMAWQIADGSWRHLGGVGGERTKVTVRDVSESPGRVTFRIRYEGDLGGPTFIEERYVVTPAGVELTTRLGGYNGLRRYVWPVLADDGRMATEITVAGDVVRVTKRGEKSAQTFRPVGASSVRVMPEKYPNHNGWARLAVAEYPAGDGPMKLIIAPQNR
jgi:hypothetical protein